MAKGEARSLHNALVQPPKDVDPPDGYAECLKCGNWFDPMTDYEGKPKPPRRKTQKRKYCSINCRKKFTTKSLAGRPKDPDHIKIAKALARGRLEDMVREVMSDEIRKAVGQVVRDKVLGAAEAMTEALPKAVAGLAVDVEDENVFIRQRAQALLFKYTMPFLREEGQKQDLGQITVIHNVPREEPTVMPDTQFGRAVAENIPIEEHRREAWEADYVGCHRCKELKHPSLVTKGLCNLCAVKSRVEGGDVGHYMDPVAFVETDKTIL